MSDLTERIQLTYIHRDLILKYGYPFERLKAALRRQTFYPESSVVHPLSQLRHCYHLSIDKKVTIRKL